MKESLFDMQSYEFKENKPEVPNDFMERKMVFYVFLIHFFM